MSVRTITYTVTKDSISPASVQRGGLQGEHKATKLYFKVDNLNLLTSMLNYVENNSENLYYRVEAHTSSGLKHSTKATNSFYDGGSNITIIEYPLENWLTRDGGIATVYLIFSALSEGSLPEDKKKTLVDLYSYPARIKFDSVPESEYIDKEKYEGMTSLAEKAAQDSREAAEAAAEEAVADVVKNLQENTEYIFDGGDSTGTAREHEELKIPNFKRMIEPGEDLDDILENGIYAYYTDSAADILNVPFANAAVIEVIGSNSGNSQKIQRATRYGAVGQSKTRVLHNGVWSEWWVDVAEIESPDYPGCFYRYVNGVQEWVNPPMMDGVEYRTTERFRGAPVYVRFVSVDLVDNGTVRATYCGRGSTDVVRYAAKIITGSYDESTGESTVRHYDTPVMFSSQIVARCLLSEYSVMFDTFREGMEVYTGYCTVWYTKD